MKTTVQKDSVKELLKTQSLQWAALSFAVRHSECFELDGTLKLGRSAKPRDFIRWRFDHEVRFGGTPEKGAICFRTIEETVFLRLLTIQVQCFRDVLNGRAEDPAHLEECRSLMEAYVARNGDRIRIQPGEMVNRGLDFLARNWSAIKTLHSSIMAAQKHRVPAAEVAELLDTAVHPEPGQYLLNRPMAEPQGRSLKRAV